MGKRFIVLDLDGTLCDCSHRVHLAQAKQWDEFAAGIPEDKVYEDVKWFAEAVSSDFEIVLCTGRNEANRMATERWLKENDLWQHISVLLMRPEGNHLSDRALKIELVDDFFGSREKALESVLLILEDRDRVVEAWREAGFRCWQVQAGSY